VKILPGAIAVLNDHGRNFAGASRIEGTDVVAVVHPAPRGAYTVRWRAISADSHVVSGVWTFGFGVPAPSVNDAYGAGGRPCRSTSCAGSGSCRSRSRSARSASG
jgi:Uncharacterized protein, homolog of Cu resistance protein CopC